MLKVCKILISPIFDFKQEFSLPLHKNQSLKMKKCPLTPFMTPPPPLSVTYYLNCPYQYEDEEKLDEKIMHQSKVDRSKGKTLFNVYV